MVLALFPASYRVPAASLPSIAVLKGEDSEAIQDFFASLAASWRACGLAVAGVVERRDEAGVPTRATTVLRDLRSGAHFPLKQALGPGSTSCSLDLQGLAAASFSVERAIEAGCDCVILSKFGKVEAQGGGLLGAFYAAIAANRPVVTSVSASACEAWAAFADPLFTVMAPDYEAIEGWRRRLARSQEGGRGRPA